MKQTSRKKVLLSSVAMMMVATVSLGSATYAWFTNTTTAKADKAKVTVAAPSGLKIAAVAAGSAAPVLNDTNFKSTIDLSTLTAGALNPVSGNATANDDIKFYTAAVDADKNVLGITESIVANEVKAIDIYGTLSASNKEGDAEKAIMVNLASIMQDETKGSGSVVRCAYYVDKAQKAYVNFSGQTRTVNPVEAIADSTNAAKLTVNDDYTISDATDTQVIADTGLTAAATGDINKETVGVKYNEATKIGTVYFWVEGQDTLCNNTKINDIAGETGNISLNFALAE